MSRAIGAHAIGERAEAVVADYLFADGFTILERNLRLGPLEIDIVARRGDLVVIVEVRTRGPRSYVGALASLTPAKRRTLLRAAERLWRERLSKMDGVSRVRIDVAAVTFEASGARVVHVPGAIVAD